MDYGGKIPVSVEKSGIANILSLAERADADQLRSFLREQRCHVGAIFVSNHEFSFFVYAPRQPISEVIAKHGGFHFVDRSPVLE